MPPRPAQITTFRALLVAAAVMVAGCASTTARSTQLPSRPPILTPSGPTHSPDAPPASPRQQVHAVVARYFHLLNRLHTDMETARFAALFTADCPCQAQVRAIRNAASRGERFVDRVKLTALRTNLDGPRLADVLADYRLIRGGLVDAAGHRITRTPPHRVRWDIRLRRVGDQWRIARIDDLS